jgi:hypothetical protein
MKDRLHALLKTSDFGQITTLITGRKRHLGTLLALTFDPDPRIAWRAVEAMGFAADRLARDNPDYVLSHLRRLHWLLSEEAGGICLMAPPAMAEIVRRRPEMFPDFIPLVISLLVTMEEEDLEHFRPSVLWAIGRLAPVAGEEIESVIPAVAEALDHSQPQVRGAAAWCLGQAGKIELLAARTDLLSDDGPVEIYMDGDITRTHVGGLLRQILPSKA